PHPHRNKPNEPAFIPLIAARIAELKGLSIDDVARVTTYNVHRLFGIGADPEREIAYQIRNSLYVALTSRCTNECWFCPRDRNPVVKGHNIGMDARHEPSLRQVLRAIGDPLPYDEVVFCGFGEPTMRWEILLETAKWLKSKGVKRVRLNTNGQGNLLYGRDIVPEMVGLFDAVSISVNEPQAHLYQKVMQSEFGEKAFEAVLDFARKCVTLIGDVTLTALNYPEAELDAVQVLAERIGAKFRVRTYNDLG
ncbi:MAG: TatD family nuclease-associated radical SAM protein, partial [bacterium]